MFFGGEGFGGFFPLFFPRSALSYTQLIQHIDELLSWDLVHVKREVRCKIP